MRVGQRLFLAVLPAIIGLLTVTALAYFGEYARQAPEWLVLMAVVASVLSAVIAWRNTHYVAMRIEQLAGRRGELTGQAGVIQRATALLGATLRPHAGGAEGSDELDRIERLVRELEDALATERAAQAERERELAERAREYTSLVDDAVSSAIHRMDEVRLPLHILLENHFGELNENQEEMLGAARAAAEASDESLRRVRDVVRVDMGELRLRRERVRLQDVMESLAPALRSAAEDREVTLEIDVPPTLPTLLADRGRLQEALSTLLLHTIRHASEHAKVTIRASHVGQTLQLTAEGGGADGRDGALALADRLLVAHGGTVVRSDGALHVHLVAPVDAQARNPGDAAMRGAPGATR